ncbi:Sensory transduction histidine kinase [Methanosarcina siciliae C2J]|uniref:histidine kinase n=3 Tax=Methanosarcina siciliae TaxID=38027 RepID=A0A0E3PDW3_9EURY|nr:GAF domain-containing protein [Methanosarcina siciliae]AKB28036.1 Sensory transduction histidine kinase [Methanosarcina siciliae T4/M]AKB31947.1 Sensory transduction histidine kinase [Methanosarcina siciliae HI350]AKB36253.1 Sensory transduction histidine kinase [Methanosarcina siciliae C2J]
MAKATSNSAKNGSNSKQKACKYLNEVALCSALEMAKELISVINKVPVTVFLWRPEKYWPAEFVSENIKHFGYTVEEFTSGKLLYGNIVHPDDLERVERELSRRIEEDYVDFSQEYRILTKSGEVRWVDERTFIEADENGVVKYLKGIILDVTERKRKEKLLYIQRDLGISLSTSQHLDGTLDILLDSCLQIDEIDVGGIYLVDEDTGDMALAIQSGFSPTFVENASYYSANSPNTKLVMIGQPVYKQHIDLLLTSRDDALRQENLRATAIIPVKSENEVIAAFYLASSMEYELSDSVRTVIETIATQFGVFISRIRLEERLKECVKKRKS